MTSRSRLLLLGGLLCFAFVYFYQAGGWNQNSRFDLLRAVVEKGTLRIDDYHRNTGDKSKVGGHFYSDKAPGQAFAAVPVYAAAYWVVDKPSSEAGVAWTSYWITATTSALPGALAALLILLAARRLGASHTGALFAALLFALGSPMWSYATLFMGHALTAGCLALAFWGAIGLGEASTLRQQLLFGAAVGLGGGWATVTEYPAGPATVILGLFALWQIRNAHRGQGLKPALPSLLSLALFAITSAAVLLIYQRIAFGSAFDTPLRHLYLFPHVREQPFTAPRATALFQILLGSKRGLLPLAPLFLLAPLGLRLMWTKGQRAAAAILAALCAYYLLFNASFATPLAGWCYGPRYLAAALPFMALPLAFVWDWARPSWAKAALALALLWGVALSLVAVSTTAQPPEHFGSPVTQLLLPAFLDGDLSLNHQSFLESGARATELRGDLHAHDAWNLGEKLLGLEGLWSLLPLLAVLVAGGVALWPRRRI